MLTRRGAECLVHGRGPRKHGTRRGLSTPDTICWTEPRPAMGVVICFAWFGKLSDAKIRAGECSGGTLSWGPQLHDGLVYVSDWNSGLWILKPEF